jgi:hypothetical protein
VFATSYHKATDRRHDRGAVCKSTSKRGRASVATLDLITGTCREARATTKSHTQQRECDTIVHSTLIQTCRRLSRRRHVHSTISCSLYLQFALLIAASCDLHRTKTLVIHHVELYSFRQAGLRPTRLFQYLECK